jgi:TRAP-type C4-dicarboxylate transport system permease large subunit
VAEDSDEFLRASARRDAGASLGRLLNVTDGVLGQGSDTIILLTTNEEIGRLHPALVRPGRCLGAVEFTEFSPTEAAGVSCVYAIFVAMVIYREVNFVQLFQRAAVRP